MHVLAYSALTSFTFYMTLKIISLFFLYVNDIQNCSLKSCIKLFPDHSHVFVYSTSLQEAAAKANKSSSVFNRPNWFVSNKLGLNVNKASYCIFEKRDNQKHDVTLQLCNMNIKRVNCIKYVGIYVHDQLNWKYHIEYVYKTLLKFVDIFYKLQHYMCLNVLRTLY